MKKKITAIAAMVLLTLAVHAQKKNLLVFNDSDPVNGCDYEVTPIVTLGDFPIIPYTLTALTSVIPKDDTHTFTEDQLFDLFGLLNVKYIGAKVVCTSGNIKVNIFDLFDADDDGDCQGGYVEANYDNTYNSTTAVMYITDEQ